MHHLILGHSDMNRRGFLAYAAVAASATLPLSLAHAQSLSKLTVSYPSRSGMAWPYWLAKDAGLYQKHGLDVTLEFGVHPAGVAMLVSGQAQMAVYGLEPILAAAIRDSSMVIAASGLSKGNFALVAQKDFKTVAELKGKRMGIGRVGDQLYVYLLTMLEKHGLTARDVQWVPTGADVSSRVKMLQVGQIDAALLVAPGYFKLESQGFKVLDLLLNYPEVFVSTVNVFKKTWSKENPDLVRRLLMAQSDAVQLFYASKDAALRAYRAFDPNQSEEDISQLYDIYKSRDVLDRIPLLQKAAMMSTVAHMTEDVPALKNFDTSSIVDMGPIRQLISQGYYRKLYGQSVSAEEGSKLANSF